jgi:hypothetical protein
MKPELIVLVLALLLVVAASNTSSLLSRARSVFLLLALVVRFIQGALADPAGTERLDCHRRPFRRRWIG